MTCEVWVNPCLKITAHLRHMDTPFEVRWRLRNGDHIVGYERHMGGRVWSSPDGFWWRGDRLRYSDKDRCFGVKDVNNEWLFQGDVVAWHPESGQWLLECERGTWTLSQGGTKIKAPEASRLLRRVGFVFRS